MLQDDTVPVRPHVKVFLHLQDVFIDTVFSSECDIDGAIHMILILLVLLYM